MRAISSNEREITAREIAKLIKSKAMFLSGVQHMEKNMLPAIGITFGKIDFDDKM